jgi:hypothetical protein
MVTSKIFLIAFVSVFATINALPISEDDAGERSKLEFGDEFQGDIVLSPEQEQILNGNSKGSRTGLLNKSNKWPKNSAGQVVVPYTFQAASGFSKYF